MSFLITLIPHTFVSPFGYQIADILTRVFGTLLYFHKHLHRASWHDYSTIELACPQPLSALQLTHLLSLCHIHGVSCSILARRTRHKRYIRGFSFLNINGKPKRIRLAQYFSRAILYLRFERQPN